MSDKCKMLADGIKDVFIIDLNYLEQLRERKPEKKKDKIKRLEKDIEGFRIALNNQRLQTEEITRKLMLEITDKIFKKYTV